MAVQLNGSKSSSTHQTSIPIELKWDRVVTQECLEDYDKSPSAPQSLFQVHRFIEQQYQNLPWPSKLNQIAVMTEVRGGRGDISGAAKVIGIMQKMCPSLMFDWIVLTGKYDPLSFLKCSDPSKVKIRNPLPMPENPTQADFLVVGPVKSGWGTKYIESKFKVSLKGPRFDFLECASPIDTEIFVHVAWKMANEKPNEAYRHIHDLFFPSRTQSSNGLSMGLQKGSGVLLDESRVEAPLSQEYCCPSYLLKLEDKELQKDILAALGVSDEKSLPDYGKNSMNSGYAHRPASWTKFIHVVAIQEREKDVTIVLNQHGEFDQLDTETFSELTFTAERLAFLKKWGYGDVVIKGAEKDPIIVQKSSDSQERKLTIILRPSFRPNDMKYLQLASERLLATGDNSAAEAWAARCKLFVYEDVANLGCKNEFLKQQIELANSISPNLGTLLRMFDMRNPPLTDEEMDLVIKILQSPSLAKETLQFCHLITQNYSFKNILEGALKRTAWHHCIPELMNDEIDVMDDEFKSGIVNFMKSEDTPPQVINIKNLPLLAERVQLRVQQYLKKEATE